MCISELDDTLLFFFAGFHSGAQDMCDYVEFAHTDMHTHLSEEINNGFTKLFLIFIDFFSVAC